MNTTAGEAAFRQDASGGCVVATGDWTLASAAALSVCVERLKCQHPAGVRIDARAIGRVDTTGADLLLALAGTAPIDDLDATRRALVDAVARARATPPAPPRERMHGFVALLVRTGVATEQVGRNAWQLLGFIGLILSTLARCTIAPRRWRITPLAFHLEQTGLDAVPIVLLLNF
jgi:phospholipid/cholesterol/gamma-HCH transport system permease protein